MKEGRHLSNFSKAQQATSEDAWALFISRCHHAVLNIHQYFFCYSRYENAHNDNKFEAKVIGVERKSQFLAVP